MIRSGIGVRSLAICLSALAGYVDAVAFLSLGGFFVSFMSGNTTRLGVGIAALSVAARTAGLLIASFVGGVMLGTLAGRLSRRHRPSIILLLLAALLAGAALLGTAGATGMAAMVMAVAMGAENAMFERDGEVQIGLTYMTGTLVKLGQGLAAALTGGPRLAWIAYLMLWLGLAAGAVAGALAFRAWDMASLWLAALGALLLLPISAKLLPATPERPI